MSLKKVNAEMLNELYELIVSVKSAEDCRDLFGDLCTNKETEQMAQRLRAAKLLLDGTEPSAKKAEKGDILASVSEFEKNIPEKLPRTSTAATEPDGLAL